MDIPSRIALKRETLIALKHLGGSGSLYEIDQRVIDRLNLPAEVAERPHPGRPSQTELRYQLAWSRTMLKEDGLIENPSSKVWTLTPLGIIEPVEESVIPVADEISNHILQPIAESDTNSENAEWRVQLLDALRGMDPIGFEHLCKALLRRAGFVSVEVTRATKDEGIDGYGVIQIADLISFPVAFQCKRWSKPVGAVEVQNFRGAMMSSKSDKGLLITTSRFTGDAEKEAVRDGATPVDLINGEELANLLKKYGLGVTVKTNTVIVEEVSIDYEFINSQGK